MVQDEVTKTQYTPEYDTVTAGDFIADCLLLSLCP